MTKKKALRMSNYLHEQIIDPQPKEQVTSTFLFDSVVLTERKDSFNVGMPWLPNQTARSQRNRGCEIFVRTHSYLDERAVLGCVLLPPDISRTLLRTHAHTNHITTLSSIHNQNKRALQEMYLHYIIPLRLPPPENAE